MKRTKSKGKAPQIRLVGWQAPAAAAVAAAGLVSAAALAAPGDLDPSFGDVGRQSDLGVVGGAYTSQLVAADALEDDDVLFGGGGEYCYWGCYVSFFVGRLGADGIDDAAFGAPVLPSDTSLHDTVPQGDGKLVGVGNSGSKLIVFRTLADGTSDPGFGTDGVVTLADPLGTQTYHGYSIVIDPDGRIVVAGVGAFQLLVARLQADGTVDPSFGANGIAIVSTVPTRYEYPVRIGRTATGGYRVMLNSGTVSRTCKVVGLTSAGAIDADYGVAGIAEPRAATGLPIDCSAMTVLPDGRVVVAGSASSPVAQVVRLLADGTQDATFDASAALAPFSRATAIAASPSGKLVVGVRGVSPLPGARVLRLLGGGSLDASYGRGGQATIELQSSRAMFPDINDLQVLSGERVLAAGTATWPNALFVARLLGDGAGSGPGVLGIAGSGVRVTENEGRATVTVRRTGGRAGAVAVTYTTEAVTDQPAATSGDDFTPVTGRLEWADGDDSDREIVVPIQSTAAVEGPEFFALQLSAPEAGAGLGTTGAEVEIAGSGYPAGHFTLTSEQPLAGEGYSAQFRVSRGYYSTGSVSVTVRVAAGTTATKGIDFASPGQRDQWQDVVLTWGDGQLGDRLVTIPVLPDKRDDPGELLVLELADPTGGAVIDAQSKATVEIVNRPSGGGGAGGGGGGQFGGLGALLLGLAGAWRKVTAMADRGSSASASRSRSVR